MTEHTRSMLDRLSELPLMELEIAYVYAINLHRSGVNVTEKWLTAVQQTEAMNRAYEKGYYDALKRCEERERLMQEKKGE